MSSPEIIVDVEDEERLARHNWSPCRYGDGLWYVTAWSEGRTIYLHREIVGAEPGVEVDHRDGDGLNNRRANLRVTTHRLNLANQRTQQRPKSSRFKGVSFYKRDGRWEASIKVDGRKRRLGCFDDEIEAAKAYNAAALAAWGEFARLNEIKEGC